ncbi:MAG: hypothetical protein JWN78_2255 [Bacteroidota bacterium]|nr:hypothetical protein [Bacteroidota bacterium]
METIIIEKCPLCNQKHEYSLEVDRSIIMKMLTPNDLYERERPYRVRRIFSCPTVKEKFEATVTLYDSSSNRINAVGTSTKIKNNNG